MRCKYESHVLPRLKDIEAWCRNGLIEKQIAKNLGIGYSTFNEYKLKYPELLEVLKRTKDYADNEVENSLFKCANGFYVTETVLVGKGDNQRTEEIKRFVQPNVLAQIFWLKNRRPAQWRDKPAEDNSDQLPDPVKIEFKPRE